VKSTRLVLLTALVLASILAAVPASAETNGWGANLALFDGEFGLQARKDFWLGGDISQITGQAGVYFANRTIWALDVDYHFVIQSASGTSRFYPLVGIDFKFNSDDSEFGINAGGGVNFMLTETLAAFAELKYVISDYDGFGVAAGIYF
jgi:opacity protein-like surface antigen